MGRAWDVGLHSPRGPGVPPGTGRPARSDLHLWYGGINTNNLLEQSLGLPGLLTAFLSTPAFRADMHAGRVEPICI